MVNRDKVESCAGHKRRIHNCRYCKRIIPITLDFCCENCLFLYKKGHRPMARKVVKK